MSQDRELAIQVKGLQLKAGSRLLLEGASLNVPKGELCLLVGASGSGKSLTLSLLSGLFRHGQGVQASGDVTVLGHDALRHRRDAGLPGTGIVFQDFALLDDVRTLENVRFGMDHRAPARPDEPEDSQFTPERYLEEFRLPQDLMPAQLSGGMKQRLALARAMAYSPELLFYDEPTSGLDPAMSREVAIRIRETHEAHGMTSLVVTHDLQSLMGIADRVILLDPEQKSLREVQSDQVDAALEDLRSFKPGDDGPRPEPPKGILVSLNRFLVSTGDFVVAGLHTLESLIPRFPSTRWGLHFFWHSLKLVALGSAIPFLAIAGFISGFITTYFMFSLLPMRGFTEPVLSEEFIGSLGYVLYRVVIPGVTTLLFATRSGAAIAADVGNRVLTRQVDAIKSHGVPPARYLLTGLSWASLVGIPLLFVVSYISARAAAVTVYLATHPGHGAFSFDDHFYGLVGIGDTGVGPFPGGTYYVLGKLLISALGTAGIAYFVGLRPKPSGASVAQGVTAAIIRATLFVLMVHLIFALFEFEQ